MLRPLFFCGPLSGLALFSRSPLSGLTDSPVLATTMLALAVGRAIGDGLPSRSHAPKWLTTAVAGTEATGVDRNIVANHPGVDAGNAKQDVVDARLASP